MKEKILMLIEELIMYRELTKDDVIERFIDLTIERLKRILESEVENENR